MDMHNAKTALFEKYCYQFASTPGAVTAQKISDKQWKNATAKFANGAKRKALIGFLDTTVMNSGKNGYLFTDDKVYYLETLEKPQKIRYNEIKSVAVTNHSKSKDSDRTLLFHMKDGRTIKWTSVFLNKTPCCAFFKELLALERAKKSQPSVRQTSGRANKNFHGTAAGLGIEGYGNVNKLYEEEKFHAQQGHGFAAERANHLYDKLTGHNAKILGDDNAKNGADRMVDGVYIQSKYCATGPQCVNNCFESNGSGTFRYMVDGQPMQIEVPSDLHSAAVEAMKKKIENGQVPGVTDPKEAANIIRKGHFTYAQAKHIAQAGTVESLTYDAVNGVIIATSALGITAILTFASSIWNGEDFDICIKKAAYSGLKVGGTSFITSVLSSQLSKAGLNSALVNSSEAIVRIMGPKASAVLINAFRAGSKPIYGAAAMKSAAKLLRGNAITAGITVAVLSSFDIANIFRGRISGKQLLKNLANTTSTVAGGTAGWMLGAAAGTALCPGPGTAIGGLIGSFAGGGAAGKAVNTVTNLFVEDDADEMVRILQSVFESIANEYLLNQSEAEQCVDSLRDILNGKLLKDMYASSNRRKFAKDLIIPIVEKCTNSRQVIAIPDTGIMIDSIRELLEDIADSEEDSN